MKKSYANAVLRRYKAEHPWAKKLPKSMTMKKDRPIDLGVINVWEDIYAEEEARRVGDGSWAIVYDESREGEWLWELADNGWVDHVCSVCRYAINTDFHVGLGPGYEKCPRCGANMNAEHGITFKDDSIYVH